MFFFHGFHSQCPTSPTANRYLVPSVTLSTTPASLKTPASATVVLTVAEPASRWTACNAAIHAPGLGWTSHPVNRHKRWSSNCALLVSVFDLQMSCMIARVADTREAKMTGACSPWNRSKVATVNKIGT